MINFNEESNNKFIVIEILLFLVLKGGPVTHQVGFKFTNKAIFWYMTCCYNINYGKKNSNITAIALAQIQNSRPSESFTIFSRGGGLNRRP